MFRETNFHREVLIYGDIIVLLQPQFVVPKDGLCFKKSTTKLSLLCFLSIHSKFQPTADQMPKTKPEFSNQGEVFHSLHQPLIFWPSF